MNGRSAVAFAAAAGATVSALAARELIRRREILDPETIALPGSRFWVNGVAIHYVERGSGFPVILIHGFGGSTFTFRHTIPALAERYRVIALDLPGFGYSDRSDTVDLSPTGMANIVTAFLQRMGIDAAVLVGHSMGGGIAQRIAVSSPQLVKGLILAGSVSAAAVPPRLPGPIAGALAFTTQAVTALSPALARRFIRRLTYEPDFITGDVLEGYLRPGRVKGSAAAVRRVMRAGMRERPVDLAAIIAPTLLVWGEGDVVVKPAVAASLMRGIAGARLEIVPHAGHLPLEEQPDTCNRILLDFIGTVAIPSRAPAGGAPA